MARRRALALVAGGLLALAAAVIATSGAVLASSGANPATVVVCDATGGGNPAVAASDGCKIPDPTTTPTARRCGVDEDVNPATHVDPTACPTPTPRCGAQEDVVPADDEDQTACPTPTPTPTAKATPCGGVDFVGPAVPANPSACPTALQSFKSQTATPSPFQSFQGETATADPSGTPPPTSSDRNGSSNGATPLLALLICLAFGGLGLAAVEAQRRSVRG